MNKPKNQHAASDCPAWARHPLIMTLVAALAALAPGCAHTGTKAAKSTVTLEVGEYREGDRSALIEVHNGTDKLLLYDGPYVEAQSDGGWTNYAFEVPEMGVLGRPHRALPSMQDAWWVRLPPGQVVWRARIRARFVAGQQTNAEPFVVYSPEMSSEH